MIKVKIKGNDKGHRFMKKDAFALLYNINLGPLVCQITGFVIGLQVLCQDHVL